MSISGMKHLGTGIECRGADTSVPVPMCGAKRTEHLGTGIECREADMSVPVPMCGTQLYNGSIYESKG